MRTGKRCLKLAGLLVGVTALAGGWLAAAHRTALVARYAAHQFHGAGDPAGRAEWAARLAALGPVGVGVLADALHTPDGAAAAAAALGDHLAAVPADGPDYAAHCRPVLDKLPGLPTAGVEAALPLVPELLGSPDPDAAGLCQNLVRAGFGCPAAESRVRAVGLSLRPGIGLAAEAAPLLSAPEPEVRRAAMLAVGPVRDGATKGIDDEALFAWLHDPDPEVQHLCASALKTRGLDEVHVGMARKLTAPDSHDRLQLLLDLWAAGDTIRDAGPWLERLARDPDPGVRAGAVRVACERRLVYAAWVGHLAETDPDPTARRLAAYYRGRAAARAEVVTASGDDEPRRQD